MNDINNIRNLLPIPTMVNEAWTEALIRVSDLFECGREDEDASVPWLLTLSNVCNEHAPQVKREDFFDVDAIQGMSSFMLDVEVIIQEGVDTWDGRNYPLLNRCIGMALEACRQFVQLASTAAEHMGRSGEEETAA